MGAVLCFGSLVALLLVWGWAKNRPRAMVAKYRGNCAACRLAITPGDTILWAKDKPVRHQDCGPFLERARSTLFTSAVAKLEKASGPATRARVLEEALAKIDDQAGQTWLRTVAARIGVRATLDKVDSLKGAKAKRRHLVEAIEALKADAVPDSDQQQEFAWLEDALQALDEEEK